MDDQVRSKPGEVLRDAAADPGRRSGHHRDLVGERAHGISTDLITRPLVHRVERLAPAGERRGQADDLFGPRQPAVEQMDHALPRRKGMAERPLQPQVLLHQGD